MGNELWREFYLKNSDANATGGPRQMPRSLWFYPGNRNVGHGLGGSLFSGTHGATEISGCTTVVEVNVVTFRPPRASRA